MSVPPDLDALRGALATLQDDLRARLHAGHHDGHATPEDWGTFAGDLDHLGEVTRYCREASILLARRAGRSWRGLERDTGTADATLNGRMDRFIHREGL